MKTKYSQEEIENALERKRKYLNKADHYTDKQLEDIYHERKTGRYISDLVYGANDGIVTTFAVVTGSVGASLSPVVIIILGFANLIADGFSMGASSYLSRRSDIDYQRGQHKKEAFEIEYLPELETQEVRERYSDMGFEGKDLDRALEVTISDKKRWLDFMMIHELGIFEDPEDKPIKHGIVTFAAFNIAGLAPLLPFLIPVVSQNALISSPIFSAIALFITGALRTLVTPKRWWVGGLEMLIIGALAGAVSYAVGFSIKTLLGTTF